MQSKIENAIESLRKAISSEFGNLVEKHKTRYKQLEKKLQQANFAKPVPLEKDKERAKAGDKARHGLGLDKTGP